MPDETRIAARLAERTGLPITEQHYRDWLGEDGVGAGYDDFDAGVRVVVPPEAYDAAEGCARLDNVLCLALFTRSELGKSRIDSLALSIAEHFKLTRP